MKGLRIVSGLQYLKKVLSFFQSSINSNTAVRVTDIFSNGAIQNSQLYGEIREFEIIPEGGLNVKVGSGLAYMNGERILIDTDASAGEVVQEVLSDYTLINSYTGNTSIALTDNLVTALWIRYQKILDDSDYTVHPITAEQLYYKTADSYQIVASPANPNVDSYLLLGDVTASGGSIEAIDYADRSLIGLDSEAVRISASYGDTLQDHVEAVGHANVTANNPHGVATADISDYERYDASPMQIATHSNGLVEVNTAVLDPNILNIDGTAVLAFFWGSQHYDRAIEFRKLHTTEKIFLNGYLFTDADSITPKCSDTTSFFNPWYDIANDYFIPFATWTRVIGDAPGTYHVILTTAIVNSIPTVVISKITTAIASNQLLLFDVVWDGTNFGTCTDNRVFGTTGTKDLQHFKFHNGKIYIDGDVIVNGNITADNI